MKLSPRLPATRLNQAGLFVVLIAMLILFYMLFMQTGGLSRKIEQVRRAFQVGLLANDRDFARHADNPNQICNELDSSIRWFCHEGIGTAVVRQLGGASERSLVDWKKKLPNRDGFNRLGLGIAFSGTDIRGERLWAALQREYRPSEQLEVLDGWGFGQIVFSRLDFALAISRCRLFDTEGERRGCFFGIGRSLLFADGDKLFGRPVFREQLNEGERRLLLLGYGFALGFVSGIAEQLSHGEQSAYLKGLVDAQVHTVQRGIRFGLIVRGFVEEQPLSIQSEDQALAKCVSESGGASACVSLF